MSKASLLGVAVPTRPPSPQPARPTAPAALAVAALLQPHPTRAVVKCHGCRHRSAGYLCNHPSVEVDIVTGEATATCLQMRVGACGPAGALFEPHHPAPLPLAPR